MLPTSKSAKISASITPASTARFISDFNSSTEPIKISSLPSSVLQIGNGIPQKRERDKFQSLAFFNQFPKRPVPVDSGFQLIVLFNSCIRSFTSVTLINQESNG